LQIAITRGVSATIAACELTHLERQAIDLERARTQHREYEAALERAGCRVESLPALDDLPDSVFVEDVAVVLDEIAIVTRPGAESRRPETAQIAPVLSNYRRVTFVEAPGTLEGGDVLKLGRRIFVGRSGRSNESGIDQLRLSPGRTATPSRRCLSGDACT
jgi:dimethylargininase